MPIYTRTGDKGKTSLFSGKRVPKYDSRVEAYGTIDELNSIIGIVVSHIPASRKEGRKLANILFSIQSDLFYIGAYLADLPDSIEDIDLSEKTLALEKNIDVMLRKVLTPTNFILPGGGKTASFLHQARTVTRRAERALVRLSQREKSLPAGRQVASRVMQYVN